MTVRQIDWQKTKNYWKGSIETPSNIWFLIEKNIDGKYLISSSLPIIKPIKIRKLTIAKSLLQAQFEDYVLSLLIHSKQRK